jgi:hypothetical protein
VTTKAALKRAAADQNSGKPRSDVWIEDPSLFKPMAWGLLAMAQGLSHAQASCVVTNHPKRSWFAEVRRQGNGNIKVK